MSDIKDELPWYPGVPKGVVCDEGWDNLIRRLHIQLVGIDPGYMVMQVKEKFGGLRYYVMNSADLDDMLRDRVWRFISEAEEESFHICEVCGEPGQLRGGSWYRTLCDLHDREREARYAALAATGDADEGDGDMTAEEMETLQADLREARHAVAERRRKQ